MLVSLDIVEESLENVSSLGFSLLVSALSHDDNDDDVTDIDKIESFTFFQPKAHGLKS